MEWMSQITEEHVKRFERDCGKYAEEPVEAELVSGVLYVYGSELGIRRIEYTFRHSKGGKTFGYSKNLGTWYFGLDINQ